MRVGYRHPFSCTCTQASNLELTHCLDLPICMRKTTFQALYCGITTCATAFGKLSSLNTLPHPAEEVRKERKKETKHDNVVKLTTLLNEVRSSMVSLSLC